MDNHSLPGPIHMVDWLRSRLQIMSIPDVPFIASEKQKWIHANQQSTDASRKINDTDVQSSIKQKRVLAHSESVISKIYAKANTSKILGLLQNEGKGNKKGDKALRNEQGLRCHK